MLNFEDKLYFSNEGQQIILDNNNLVSLEGSKIIQRITLNNFGFESKDYDLDIYRKIFSYYYKSSIDYDKEILNSVYYMRENRCLYYTSPKINVGDIIPDITIFDLDGINKVNLHTIIKSGDYDKSIIAGFSMS